MSHANAHPLWPAVKIRLEHIEGSRFLPIEAHVHADRQYMPKLVLHKDRAYELTGTTDKGVIVYRDILATVVESP